MKTTDKKPYIKPEVMKVELVAGEAVLANCKAGEVLGCEGDPCGGFTPAS